jgi:hypothetical protein
MEMSHKWWFRKVMRKTPRSIYRGDIINRRTTTHWIPVPLRCHIEFLTRIEDDQRRCLLQLGRADDRVLDWKMPSPDQMCPNRYVITIASFKKPTKTIVSQSDWKDKCDSDAGPESCLANRWRHHVVNNGVACVGGRIRFTGRLSDEFTSRRICPTGKRYSQL